MNKDKIDNQSMISAGGNVSFEKNTGQNAIGNHIIQIQINGDLSGEKFSEIISSLKDKQSSSGLKYTAEELKNRKFALKNIVVSGKEKDIIRIATVQLDFELSDSFPPEIKEKENTIDKIFRALRKARENNVDVICFPELSFCEEWVSDIKKQYSDMIIIAGTYYNQYNNVCRILIDSDRKIPPQLKAEPSAFEDGEYVQKMISGESLNIYETRYGTFSVLICRDFPVHAHRLRNLVDVVFVPSYNDKIKRFYSDAHAHVQNSPSYVIISNSSKYGGTSIFGIMHNAILNQLVEVEYKKNNDNTYNLCEIENGREGIIFADFNIVHKSIQTPTLSDSSSVVKPVKNINRIYF